MEGCLATILWHRSYNNMVDLLPVLNIMGNQSLAKQLQKVVFTLQAASLTLQVLGTLVSVADLCLMTSRDPRHGHGPAIH